MIKNKLTYLSVGLFALGLLCAMPAVQAQTLGGTAADTSGSRPCADSPCRATWPPGASRSASPSALSAGDPPCWS